jgi:hypothetical protein
VEIVHSLLLFFFYISNQTDDNLKITVTTFSLEFKFLGLVPSLLGTNSLVHTSSLCKQLVFLSLSPSLTPFSVAAELTAQYFLSTRLLTCTNQMHIRFDNFKITANKESRERTRNLASQERNKKMQNLWLGLQRCLQERRIVW